MSDTTAVFGKCFACGGELRGGYTVTDGCYFHHWCAPKAEPERITFRRVRVLANSEQIQRLNAEIAALRAALAAAEEALEPLVDQPCANEFPACGTCPSCRARAVRERLAKLLGKEKS